jgi:glycosyltransferase involved in cell wall biosynthesis
LLVESFEPHAEYAVEAVAWRRHGVRATFLRASEWLQRRRAMGIMPVARWYSERLVERGVPPERLRVVPCGVPLERFAFSSSDRDQVRHELAIGSEPIGIYVGKFGDFYYDREAFELFRNCFHALDGLHLILLTPTDRSLVATELDAAGIDRKRVHVDCVPHDAVPRYLSAADFAFALYPPSPSKRALSPTKNGEYWASGLPVLLTRGVGDEADFLEPERAGALLDADLGNAAAALSKVMNIVAESGHRSRIASVAARYRSFDAARAAYRDFLAPLAHLDGPAW